MKDQAKICLGCKELHGFASCRDIPAEDCDCLSKREPEAPADRQELSVGEQMRRLDVGVKMHFSEWEFDRLLKGE